MAAALRLSEAGYGVELFEKRAVLGGRASSFIPPGESAPIDNCQHVLLGCCTNLIDFFRRAGVDNHFRYYDRYLFQKNGIISTLSASPLPAPLHFLPSLACFRALPWRDRWAIARAMLAILRTPQPFPDESLAGWLDRHGQSAAAKQHFWKVILVSAEFWKRWRGTGAPQGETLRCDNETFTVVGVMPEGFDYPAQTALWAPREITPPQVSRTAHNFQVVARLADGVTLEQARADISALSRRLKDQYGDGTWMFDATAVPLLEVVTSTSKAMKMSAYI